MSAVEAKAMAAHTRQFARHTQRITASMGVALVVQRAQLPRQSGSRHILV